jgi:hypothetical protein
VGTDCYSGAAVSCYGVRAVVGFASVGSTVRSLTAMRSIRVTLRKWLGGE